MHFWDKFTSGKSGAQGQMVDDHVAVTTSSLDRLEYYQRHNTLIRSQCSGNLFPGVSIKDALFKSRQEDLYDSLNLMVGDLLQAVKKKLEIDKGRVTGTISSIIDDFMTTGGHDLLLLSNTFTGSEFLSSHVANSFLLTMGFARTQGFAKKELMEIAFCSIFHDIGMVDFVNYAKSQRRLDPNIFNKIRQHPVISADICNNFLSTEASKIIMDIHEREQGQGYPRGKKGEDISPSAKIISICDVYEALTHPRPYRQEYPPFEAIKILIKMKDTLLEGAVIKKWIDFISIYPIGSLVFLNTGEIALVMRSNAGMPMSPFVNVILDEKNKAVKPGRSIDLSKNNVNFIKRAVTEQEKQNILSRNLTI